MVGAPTFCDAFTLALQSTDLWLSWPHCSIALTGRVHSCSPLRCVPIRDIGNSMRIPSQPHCTVDPSDLELPFLQQFFYCYYQELDGRRYSAVIGPPEFNIIRGYRIWPDLCRNHCGHLRCCRRLVHILNSDKLLMSQQLDLF